MGLDLHSRGTQPKVRTVQDEGHSTTLSGYAGDRAGRCQKWQTMQNSSQHRPRWWGQRHSNTGVWCSKIKSFQFQ